MEGFKEEQRVQGETFVLDVLYILDSQYEPTFALSRRIVCSWCSGWPRVICYSRRWGTFEFKIGGGEIVRWVRRSKSAPRKGKSTFRIWQGGVRHGTGDVFCFFDIFKGRR